MMPIIISVELMLLVGFCIFIFHSYNRRNAIKYFKDCKNGHNYKDGSALETNAGWHTGHVGMHYIGWHNSLNYWLDQLMSILNLIKERQSSKHIIYKSVGRLKVK